MQLAARKWAVVLGIALMAGVVALVSFADMNKSLVYYLTPDELLAKGLSGRGAVVRLGGLVQHHSMTFEPKTLRLNFRLAMLAEGGTAVTVQSHGAPPQMFSEGTGAVVEGIYDGEVFHAERVMVKHSNEYRPPAPGDAPKNLYTTLRPPDN
jgi:cytochrome c-type biogenesis protein CcmE